MRILIKYLLISTFLILSSITYGQVGTNSDLSEAEKIVIKPDKYERRTPRGTVEGFLGAIADEDYERAAEYLNLDFISKSERADKGSALAKKLQYMLDHSGKLEANVLISEYTDGHLQDGLDLNLDKVGVIKLEDGEIPVLLEQIRDPENLPIWLISAETLQKLPKVAKSNKKIFVVDDYLPEIALGNKIFGVSLVHWLMIIVTFLIAYAIAKSIIFILLLLFHKTSNKYISVEKSVLFMALRIPARLWLSVYVFIFLLQYLSIPIIMRSHFNSLAVAIYLVAFLILLWQIANILHTILIEKFKRTNNTGFISIVDFLLRSVRFLLITTGILLGLHLYDHNVTTGLAALGIGGIAIALGAQKTLENIAGSINVVIDQTVHNGDLIKVAGIMGFIEQVGIRSTKIRTLEDTVVTIPNAEFSTQQIENYSKRRNILFNYKIGIRYESSPDQVRYVLIKIREMLYAHPKVSNENQFVKFSEFGPDYLEIYIFSYIRTNNYFEYIDIKEDLLLRIMDIIEQSGTSFAFPSQTVYLSKDTGLSKELTAKAKEEVNNWKAKGELQIPRFSDEKLKEIADSLSYPAPGSALYKD